MLLVFYKVLKCGFLLWTDSTDLADIWKRIFSDILIREKD
jgi:hypothetical protein